MPRIHASKLGIACGTTRRLKRCDVIRELHRLGDKLRSVVGPDVSGNAPQDQQVGQNIDYMDRLEVAGDTDRKADDRRGPITLHKQCGLIHDGCGPHLVHVK